MNQNLTGVVGLYPYKGKIEIKFIPTSQTTADEGYIIHPAFQDGSKNGYKNGEWKKELSGIWVGKYEASHGDATISSEGSNTNLKIVPSVRSWINQTIGEFYTIAYNYDREKESHLMKNSEWGATVYLTHSQYGRNGNEVTRNNNKNYVTGIAGNSVHEVSSISTTNTYNTPSGQLASSTGNIYGVYGLNGGSGEYVSAFNNDLGLYASLGSSFADPTRGSTPYATMYTYTTEREEKPGDATYEVAHPSYSNSAWLNETAHFIWKEQPFFARGGFARSSGISGIFAATVIPDDYEYEKSSFRVVLAP